MAKGAKEPVADATAKATEVARDEVNKEERGNVPGEQESQKEDVGSDEPRPKHEVDAGKEADVPAASEPEAGKGTSEPAASEPEGKKEANVTAADEPETGIETSEPAASEPEAKQAAHAPAASEPKAADAADAPAPSAPETENAPQADAEPNVASTPSDKGKAADTAPHATSQPTASAPPPAAPATPSASSSKAEAAPKPVAPKPFDFNRFLEQMKHRSAVPVNEYVRSFFRGFTKRPYKPGDQVKLIFDFLDFISARMAEASVWASLSDADFDQATEAMEKLIMNRLYTYTFTPAIAQEGHWSVQTNDLERDQVLSQRIRLLSWVEERHLDMARGSHSPRFNDFAVQELLKINHYRAPRDKIICILNCCKVIFGLIRHLGKEENADAFVPLLILVLLRANPPHLVSNVEYILRFKNPHRPSSEADYYLSSLSGAISFIESMDHTQLSNVTQEEFDAHVQRAGAELEAEAAAAAAADNSSLPLHAQVAAVSIADDARQFLQRTGEAARAGLTSSFSRPMGALGKLLYERIDEALGPSDVQRPLQTPAPSASQGPRRGSAPNAPMRGNALAVLEDDDDDVRRSDTSPAFDTPARPPQWRSGFVPRTLADDDETRDSPSHHVAAAQRAPASETSFEGDTSVDWEAGTQTLKSIFPQAEDSVLLLILQECHGNVETAIDRLLEMT